MGFFSKSHVGKKIPMLTWENLRHLLDTQASPAELCSQVAIPGIYLFATQSCIVLIIKDNSYCE